MISGRTVKKSEKELWNRMVSIVGCIACRKDGRRNDYCSIHHIEGRTKPGCHEKVLPLCPQHHQQDDTDPFGRIAVHPNIGRFEQKYGRQLDLLAETLEMIGVK